MEMVGTMAAPGTQAKVIELYQKRNYTAAKAASAILSGVARNKKVLPISPEAWIGYYVKRFFPRALFMILFLAKACWERGKAILCFEN